MSLPAPVFTTAGSTDPQAPLVVFFHGIGEDESTMQAVAETLPDVAAYVSLRGPYQVGRGHNWFRQVDGRIDQDSFTEAMQWFSTWLDEVAPEGRAVIVAGFSAGAAMAGTLALEHPERYVGAAVLSGALPLEPRGLGTPGRLAGLPVFLAQSEQDLVIKPEYTRDTWDYLVSESGAPVLARRDPGGHEVSAGTAEELGDWITRRLQHLESSGRAAVGVPDSVTWAGLPDGLPTRAGGRPLVSWAYPQQQFSDQADADLHDALFARIEAFDGVTVGESRVAVPGSRAFFLIDAAGPAEAFVVAKDGEFAHLHPLYDTSLHLVLPVDLAADAIAKGWAQPHMHAGTRKAPGFVLVYGPRTEAELDIVTAIADAARRHAGGA